jgi:hypothetical protein
VIITFSRAELRAMARYGLPGVEGGDKVVVDGEDLQLIEVLAQLAREVLRLRREVAAQPRFEVAEVRRG